MQSLSRLRRHILGGSVSALALAACAAAFTPGVARADDAATMNAVQQEIKALQAQLNQLKTQLKKNAQAPAPAPTAVAAPAAAGGMVAAPVPNGMTAPNAQPQVYLQQPRADDAASMTNVSPGFITQGMSASTKPSFKAGGITVTIGGFIEAAGIFRSRNEVADVGSSYNTGIPFANSPLYHQNEFRGSARQSRLSFLFEGKPDAVTDVSSYIETDFLGAAPTANSIESNSYNLRLRQALLQYNRSDLGVRLSAGQGWSLATMTKHGLTPLSEDIPLTIDAQYVVGFAWTRNMQARVVKSLDDNKVAVGFSVESPQTNYYQGPNGAAPANVGSVNVVNPGGSLYSSGTNYSTDTGPDMILKAAYDPTDGQHYEIFGLARFMQSTVSIPGATNNKMTIAGGGGAGTILTIVPNVLEFQLSGMVGNGIGRYGSAQMPDATVSANGSPAPIPEVIGLAGLVYHPTPSWDVYTYLGTERASDTSFGAAGKGYGYGSFLYSNAGCYSVLSPLSCVGNTQSVDQLTVGAWHRFYHGPAGTVILGAQYSYTERYAFAGSGGSPSTNENIIMASLRYYPFQ